MTAVATKPRAAKKAAPMPVQEAEALALRAAGILNELVLPLMYDGGDVRPGANAYVTEAARLLGRLLSPAGFDREPADPADGDINDHLARIADELDRAVSTFIALPEPPPKEVGEAVFLLTGTQTARLFAAKLSDAFHGLPGTLETLRALTTYAGALPYRDPPRPPIRRESAQEAAHAAFHDLAIDALSTAQAKVGEAAHVLREHAEYADVNAIWGLLQIVEPLPDKIEVMIVSGDMGGPSVGALSDLSSLLVAAHAVVSIVASFANDSSVHATASLLEMAKGIVDDANDEGLAMVNEASHA